MKITKVKIAEYIGSRIPYHQKQNRIMGYVKISDYKDYAIYQRPLKSINVIAAFNNMVVLKKDDKTILILPHYRFPYLRYTVRLNAVSFPGLWEGSSIFKCILLPYMRRIEKDKYLKSVRLCVITDKGQIFHNYPSRDVMYEGHSVASDIIKFEESVVWDLPERKYPSPNYKHLDTECYYPNLPDECYQYHPIPNDSDEFVDNYGNGGFPRSTTVMKNGDRVKVSRFYQYARTSQSNSFYFIGTGERNWKMNIIGTYRSNTEEGVRTCIFATHDGGRSWYCKYEFSDMGEYIFQQGHSDNWGKNFGNPVKCSENFILHSVTGMSIRKRELILPQKEEDNVLFQWSEKIKVDVFISDNGVVLETDVPHGLSTGNIIAINGNKCNNDRLSEISWMINNHISSISCGNGILFKVDVLSKTKIKLYELVSSVNNTLPCRHVHHINLIKDGWIIGTGEIYPNSWLLYFQKKENDTYTLCNAWDEFPIVRLNSSDTSIERTMGVILLDNIEKSLIYASDHDMSERKCGIVKENNICRGSTGIFKGSLKDINDRNQFNCIFEASEPCFYFQKINDIFVFCGQRGELAISKKLEPDSWITFSIDKPIIHYFGNVGQMFFFDDIIIVKK